MSIRVAPSGLSFYIAAGKGKINETFIAYPEGKSREEAVKTVLSSQAESLPPKEHPVQIMLDTVDTVYVPAEALKICEAAYYLNEAGICPTGNDIVITSTPSEELCAIMSYDRGTIETFREMLGNSLSVFSPLQENIEIRKNVKLPKGGFILNITEQNIYITSFDAKGRLLMAETYPYSAKEDILFYLEKLTQEFGQKHPKIYLYGSKGTEYRKLLKKYFKKTECV